MQYAIAACRCKMYVPIIQTPAPVTASLKASEVAHWVSTLSDGKWASYAPLFLDLDGSAFNDLTLDQLETLLQKRAVRDIAAVYDDWRRVVNAANWPAAVVKHPCGVCAVVLCLLLLKLLWSSKLSATRTYTMNHTQPSHCSFRLPIFRLED